MRVSCVVFLLVCAVCLSAAELLQLHRRAEFSHHERRLKIDPKSGKSTEKYQLTALNVGVGTHFTWLYVGSPPQRVSVIVDTGSSITAFPCDGCKHCGMHTDPYFNATASSTIKHVSCKSRPSFKCPVCYKHDRCVVKQSYSEGSRWSAVIMEDNVVIGNQTAIPAKDFKQQYKGFGTRFRFGCQKRETGLFVSQVADGIMGMSDDSVNTIVHKLYEEKKLSRKRFSLCISAKGGSMGLGAPAVHRHKTKAQYAKLYSKRHNNWFTVAVKDVRLNGNSIKADPKVYVQGKKFIVDSGTTETYLPVHVKHHFLRTFKRVSGYKYRTIEDGECDDGYVEEDLPDLPNIQIVLYGLKKGEETLLEIEPRNYLTKINGRYCSQVYLTEKQGGVIGANAMMDHDVIFDSTKRRIGIAKAHCDFVGPPPVIPTYVPAVRKHGESDDPELPIEITIGVGVVFFTAFLAVCSMSCVWCVKWRRKRKWKELDANSVKGDTEEDQVDGKHSTLDGKTQKETEMVPMKTKKETESQDDEPQSEPDVNNVDEFHDAVGNNN